jgi:peptidoglycan/LPS O-acetylase OafA/YrhL
MEKTPPGYAGMSSPTPSPPPARLYSLDVLRGLAALAVVFTHWSDFYFRGTTRLEFSYAWLPGYSFLAPLYNEGWRAVDVFFCLSGFIFYVLYAESIATRRTRAGEFALLRFSRLYPLHLATLLLVAGLQWSMHAAYGSFQIVPTNDLTHFALHLFFASSWGYGDISFNGPVWSVSVEILLYAVFFGACALGWRRWWQLALLALAGLALQFTNRFCPVGRGLFDFFLGALCALLYQTLRASGRKLNPTLPCLLTLAAWIVAVLNVKFALLPKLGGLIFGETLRVAGHTVPHLLTHFGFHLLPFQILPIPLTILTLAWVEDRAGDFFRPFAFLGDISYSSYLLHFPLQIACAALAFHFAWPVSLYATPGFMLIFMGTLLLLSLASFHGFERPVQRWLRRCFQVARPPLAKPTPLARA